MQTKKVLSLFLAFLLAFGVFSPIYATESTTDSPLSASDQQVPDSLTNDNETEEDNIVDPNNSQDQDLDQQQTADQDQAQDQENPQVSDQQTEATEDSSADLLEVTPAALMAETLTPAEEAALTPVMNKINQAKNRTEIYQALDALNPAGWEKLSGTAKQVNCPDMFLYLLNDKYAAPYGDVSVFKADLKKALAIGYICDRNYYESPLSVYVDFYQSINPLGEIDTYADMTESEQLVIAAALRALPGARMTSSGNYISWYFEYDDSYAKYTEYEKYDKGPSGKYDDGHIGMFASIETATDNSTTYPLVDKMTMQPMDGPLAPDESYTFKDLPAPANGDTRIYFTSHMDKVDVHKDGFFVPQTYSVNNKVSVGYLDYNKTTFTISSYGVYSNLIDDGAPYEGKLFDIEAGKIGAVFVEFDRELYNKIKTMPMNSLIEQVTLQAHDGTISSVSATEIKWISERNLKINIALTDMAVGDKLEVSFHDIQITVDNTASFDKITSSPVIADTISPVGKITTPKQETVNEVKIMFSEYMHADTEKSTTSEFIDQLWIVNQPDAKAADIPVDLTGSTAAWDVDADGRSIATVTLSTAVQIGVGQHLKATYKENVKDLAGNLINTSPTVIPIGGGLTIKRDDIYEAIRVAAGGRTPTIFIAGSSSENLAIAKENYNDPTGAQSGFAFATHGFEPVFMPIATDNYQTGAQSVDNIALANSALAAFFCGGDQLKHARSFLNDDGSDSPLMTAVRQIYASGGVVTGSSAGDHIMSDLQITNSHSWEAIMKNDPKNVSIKDYRNADDNTIYFVARGFGFAKDYGLTDSHFSERGRLGRLVLGQVASKQNMGIGVDENTAIVLQNGIGRVIGENTVTLADISDASINHLYSKHFNAQNVKVHLLSHGDTFNFRTNTVNTAKPSVTESGQVTAPKGDIFGSKQMRTLTESLVKSTAKTVSDVSKEKNPAITVTFTKAEDTKAWDRTNNKEGDYTVGQYTVENLRMDITDDTEKTAPPIDTGNGGGGRSRNNSTKTAVVDQPKEETPAGQLPTAPAAPFGDIQNHWAKDDIKAMMDLGLFKGVDSSRFAPDTAMTRAMFITVLARFSGEDLAPYTSSRFVDVAPGQWYTQAVEWAADRRITSGTGDGNFHPNDTITREQMAVMLQQYLQYKGGELPAAADKVTFNDEAKISSWSKEAVQAMQQAEIISGKPGNAFDPQGTATRAEACTMLSRVVALMK